MVRDSKENSKIIMQWNLTVVTKDSIKQGSDFSYQVMPAKQTPST
jgi:hypothetical protein